MLEQLPQGVFFDYVKNFFWSALMSRFWIPALAAHSLDVPSPERG